MKIQIFIFNKEGSHRCHTETEFDFGVIIQPVYEGAKQIAITNAQGSRFIFSNMVIKKRESFLDYLFGGCEIGVHLGIDFTASNRKIDDPDSLHCYDETKNQYITCMNSISHILQNYDSD